MKVSAHTAGAWAVVVVLLALLGLIALTGGGCITDRLAAPGLYVSRHPWRGQLCQDVPDPALTRALGALRAQAESMGILRRIPPATVVCLIDAPSLDCGVGRPLAGCATSGGVVAVALHWPGVDWRTTLLDELAKRLVLAEAVKMAPWTTEDELLAQPAYKALYRGAWARMSHAP